MLALAAPVVMAELGWVTMGIVDTLMVGRPRRRRHRRRRARQHRCSSPSPSSRWACCSGSIRSSRRRSARARLDECHRWLVDGVWLCAARRGSDHRWCCSGLRASLGRWGLPAGRAASHAPVPRDPDVEPAAAAALRGVPPLPAGHGHRAAGDVRARRGQPRQRRRQLDADLRPPRRAGAWACADRPGRRSLARVFMAALAVRRDPASRARDRRPRLSRHAAAGSTSPRHAPAVRARAAGGRSGRARSRRLRGGHRARRARVGRRRSPRTRSR